MAKLSMKLKQQAEPKFSTRRYNRCKICGRPHAYLRDYGICRICFRELAHKGQIPGVRKASWSFVWYSRTGCPNHPVGFPITMSPQSAGACPQPAAIGRFRRDPIPCRRYRHCL